MKLMEFELYYVKNKLPMGQFEEAKNIIIDLDQYARNRKFTDIDDLSESDLDDYIQHLRFQDKLQIQTFHALMRYFKVSNQNHLFIRLTRFTGGLGVIENILKRLDRFISKEVRYEIMEGLVIPELGTLPQEFPQFTKKFNERLNQYLSEEEVIQVLAGNNHDVSREAMMPEKIEYENAPSLEVYLQERHQRKIEELQNHADSGKVWFEQEITQEVVDFVASSQEILSARLEDNKLYITKIPYDTVKYLQAKTNQDKRYYACHCTFAREAILQPGQDISRNWCYCSAGFAKFPFEVILDQSLPIQCLDSALDRNDDRCRFVIDLAGIDYKK